jgi:hypothetical protein
MNGIVSADEQGFWKRTWDQVDWFAVSFTGDLIKFGLVLIGLLMLHLVTRLLEITGYPAERLASLETLHYWASYATYVILGFAFVFKLFGAVIKW